MCPTPHFREEWVGGGADLGSPQRVRVRALKLCARTVVVVLLAHLSFSSDIFLGSSDRKMFRIFFFCLSSFFGGVGKVKSLEV